MILPFHGHALLVTKQIANQNQTITRHKRKMNRAKTLLLFVLVIGLVSCAPATTSVPTETATPTSTFAPTLTSTPKPTRTLIPTPEPIFVTLNSPYPSDCGDGIPRMWSNDSFNGLFRPVFDDHHGHVDIRPPKGCSPPFVVLAPIGGTLRQHAECDDLGCKYELILPSNFYPLGIEAALRFSGIENPQIKNIEKIALNFGHLSAVVDGKNLNRVDASALVFIGQPIGTLTDLSKIGKSGTEALGYQVILYYQGKEYMFSPTLLPQVSDGNEIVFTCVINSPYDCEPEQKDYAP
jgi:hypothetical protein